MKGMISKKLVIEQARQINIKATVRAVVHERQTSVNKTSLRLGYTESYLSTLLKKKDHHISLLVALSIHLQINLLENYFLLMPAHLRITKREKELLQQVADSEKKILNLEKERDWLKEVVGKK